MTKIRCARCLAEVASSVSRPLQGIVAASLCWRCSHPAFHAPAEA